MEEENYVQPWADRAAALELHERAAVAGLAPQILAKDREKVTLERVAMTLRGWWEINQDGAARESMRLRLRDRVNELHAIGICHRDLHSENVMVGGDASILFIDFAVAQPVDPSWPCYDLTGPNEHVAVPYAHASQAGHEGGVWWGPAISHRCLKHVIGNQPT